MTNQAYQAYQVYQDNSVNTATPAELTLMLYNGCLKFIKQARKGMETGNYELKNTMIQKSQNIIRELMLTLDQKAPIANQMMPLYDFINHSLVQANLKNDLEELKKAEEMVLDFRNTWKEVIKQERIRQYGRGAKA